MGDLVVTVFFALIMGTVMGLFGAGGGILTVPALRYLLGHSEKAAIAESLAVVALVALGTTYFNARERLVSWRHVIVLAAPSFAGALVGSSLAFLASGRLQLILLAVLMLAAAVVMVAPLTVSKENVADAPDLRQETKGSIFKGIEHWRSVALAGFCIGMATGFLGVGGGFFLVPALLRFGKLEIRRAVATSLALQALNALSALVVHTSELHSASITVDYSVVVLLVLLGQIGALGGRKIGKHMPQRILKRLFGVLLVVVAIGIFWEE